MRKFCRENNDQDGDYNKNQRVERRLHKQQAQRQRGAHVRDERSGHKRFPYPGF